MPTLRQSDDPEQQTPFGSLMEDEPPRQESSQLRDELAPEERLEAKTVIVGDEPVRKGNRQTHEGTAQTLGDTPMRASPEPGPEDEGTAELKRQLAFQQQATAQATAAANAEYQGRIQAERGLNQSNVSMIESAIDAANKESEQARQIFQSALDRGDHAMASRAQIAISDARSNLLRLMEMREGVANAPQDTRPRGPQPGSYPQRPTNDPMQLMQRNVNALAGHLDNTGFPKSAQWIRAHPELVRDKRSIDAVDGAHSFVTNTLGLVAETDAYFDALEDQLSQANRMAPPQGATRRDQRLPVPQRMLAAPARSEAPSLRTGYRRGTAVSLTPDQRHHARDVLGMSDEEYASEFLNAQDRGRIGGSYGNYGAGAR